MEIRKVQAEAMRRRAQSLREAACGFSSGVSRTLLELADAIDQEAELLEARAAGGVGCDPPRDFRD
jgi:predicted trehalose synthase